MASCVSDITGDDVAPDGDGDDGEGIQAAAVSPMKVNIGFQGDAGTFEYWPDFSAATVVQPGNKVCHYYFPWNVGNQAANAGDPTDPTSRP